MKQRELQQQKNNLCAYGLTKNNVALTDNLVSYWKLDESSGNIADSAGGYTLTNSGVTFETGKIGNCGVFDETDRASTTNTALNLGTFTYSAWIKTSDTSNYKSVILVIGTGGAGNGPQWRVEQNLKQQLNKQGVAGIATSNTAITSGEWQHIAVSYNGSDGATVFYLNGSADGGGTSKQTFGYNNFGIGYNSASEGFIGNIDEVGVWSRVLSAEEISALYNSGAGLQYPFTTTNIKKFNGVAYANIKKINGVAKANVKKLNGIA